jgi:hypothetical protein
MYNQQTVISLISARDVCGLCHGPLFLLPNPSSALAPIRFQFLGETGMYRTVSGSQSHLERVTRHPGTSTRAISLAGASKTPPAVTLPLFTLPR